MKSEAVQTELGDQLNPEEDLQTSVPSVIWSVPDGATVVREPRTWDLTHQQIQVRFDFNSRSVLGKTILFFKPMADRSVPIRIDAKKMQIESVHALSGGQIKKFTYDSTAVLVWVSSVQDSIGIQISYRAFPPSQTGLHFVDPTGIDTDVPTQIWTLGQPEDNSYWLPTVDRPDERISHELWISLPDPMISISNGTKLFSSKTPGDSLTTEYWRMDKSHPPYLIAFAAGDFGNARSIAGNVKLEFFAEKKYIPFVDKSFKNTTLALEFIEKKTKVPYAWDAYSQVAVREFSAGGMENTGCSILFEGVQVDRRSALDIDNQDLVMHELVHQWFGNLVTCKDWSQLTLQEGLATFFELRFREETDGKDAANHQIEINRQEYFEQASYLRHPLIWKNYEDPYDVFDKHAYNKGGQVFTMLYDFVGEEHFFLALNKILTKYRNQNIDDGDFQIAFETVSGRNLDAFFNQWFYGVGHPEIQIQFSVSGNTSTIDMKQIQDKNRQPVFALQTDYEVTFASGKRLFPLKWTGADTTISIPGKVIDVVFDPENRQLAEIRYNWSVETFKQRIGHANSIVRFKALQALLEMEDVGILKALYPELLTIAEKDTAWFNREIAFSLLTTHFSDKKEVRTFALSRTIETEKEGRVRIHAFEVLARDLSQDAGLYFSRALSDSSYFVAAEAMLYYAGRNPGSVVSKLKPLAAIDSYDDVLKTAFVKGLVNSTESQAFSELSFIALHATDRPYSVEAVRSISERLTSNPASKSESNAALEVFKKVANTPFQQKRFAAYTALMKHNRLTAKIVFEQKLTTKLDSNEKRLLQNLLKQAGE